MPDHPTFERGLLPPAGVDVLRWVIRALFALFADIEVIGREHLPASGGFILTPNHLSRFDPPLIFTALPGRKMTALVANTYRSNWLFYNVMRMVGIIWVNRGATGPSTIKAAVQALREGYVLGLAPEGTRSQVTRALQEGKTGVAFLARMADATIVPVGLTNTEKMGQAMLRLRRTRLTVRFGKPFTLPRPEGGKRATAEQLEEYTTEIMCRIAALLPPEYRGVYLDHPRVKELLIADGR